MDQFLLHAVVSEAARRLLEQEVARVSFLGRSRYLLRFATQAKDNLLISARPDLPRLHLFSARRAAEEPADRFAACLDRELAGAILTRCEKRPWDRVVELRFRVPRRDEESPERRLVVELFGRAADLLLLDAQGVVIESCHAPGRQDPPR